MQTVRFRSNVWKLYAYWFFHSLIFAYVIERLYGLERGITIEQMVYLEIIYAVVVALLEVPTGALADRWSRSKMMVLSAIFIFFEFFVLVYAYDFWIFVLSVLCAAMGGALASGTSNALLYDSLKTVSEPMQFEKTLGRIDLLGAIAGVLASLIGGVLAAMLDLTATYLFSLIGPAIALLFALTLRDPPIRTTTGEIAFWKHIKEALQFIGNERSVIFMIAYGTVLGATWIYVDEFWQIYVQEIAVPVGFFGIVGLLSLVGGGVGGLLAPYLKERLSYRVVFSSLLFAAVASLFALSFTRSLWGLLFLFLVNAVYYLARPIILGFVHHRIESKRRATVDSFQALIYRLGTILVGLPFGYISTHYSVFAGFYFLGVLVLLYATIYLALQTQLLKE
jgi:predicted MFS family arabinose efflux permease